MRHSLTRYMLCGLPFAFTTPATAQEALPPEAPRQALDQAWWTGPMLANSAATLPQGHVLVETYAFDQIVGRTSSYGSLTYLLYGVTDTLTLGARPMFGFN